jgi:hypothetical protein
MSEFLGQAATVKKGHLFHTRHRDAATVQSSPVVRRHHRYLISNGSSDDDEYRTDTADILTRARPMQQNSALTDNPLRAFYLED